MALMATCERLCVRILTAAVLISVYAAGIADARSNRRRANDQASFAYYLLSLSYAPDFCAQPAGNKNPRECGAGRHIGFVVHGLWPQGENGRGPERCENASPVSEDLIRVMLNYIPSESLIQHEWQNHGTCSGLSAGDYFASVRKARDSVMIPAGLKQPAQPLRKSPAEIEALFAAANPGFPKEAFRVSCYRDGELQEVRICFQKDLSPRACGASAGECAAGSVEMLPAR